MKKGLLLTIAACIALLPACCHDWCFWRKKCHRNDCEKSEYVETRHEEVSGCSDGSCRRLRREVREESPKSARVEHRYVRSN
jgi:hypothetical protein